MTIQVSVDKKDEVERNCLPKNHGDQNLLFTAIKLI